MSLGRAQFLNIKPEERKLVFSLVGILAMATLVLELSDVIATVGFISKVGPNNIIWLWIIDMVVSILTAGVYALAVDKTDRLRLVKGLTLGFAILFLLLRFIFSVRAPDWVSYPVLYILTDQFYVIFPLAFWAMVNDLFTSAEAKRIYPIITMGTALGSILGNGFAALSGWILQRSGGEPASLLPMGSLVLLSGLVVLEIAFSHRTINARQSRDAFDLKQTVNVGLDYIKNVPIFTYLAISMLLSGLAFTVIEYHFLFSIDQSVFQRPVAISGFLWDIQDRVDRQHPACASPGFEPLPRKTWFEKFFCHPTRCFGGRVCFGINCAGGPGGGGSALFGATHPAGVGRTGAQIP
ncbi:MAG: hypothetical protein HYR93_00670 [Chloroflexi bacterium]|nr:hypothetical protein [Chloroflexota bacterium]